MGGRRDWLLGQFPWIRSRSNAERSALENHPASDVVSQNPTSDDDPQLINLLKQVIALRQSGDVQGSLDLVDRSLADGIFSNYLLDNRGRALIQLNRCVEAIPIWWTLYQAKPQQYESILTKQLVRILKLTCRSQGWMPQHIVQEIETLASLEASVLKECELLRGYAYTPLIVRLIDTALENQFKTPWLILIKAKALIDLKSFDAAKNLLNQLQKSVQEPSTLHSIEDILAALASDVDVERVLQHVAELKVKGDLDAAQDLLVHAMLQNPSCVLFEEKLQELLVERGEQNPQLQAFELFLGEAERMRTAASMSGP